MTTLLDQVLEAYCDTSDPRWNQIAESLIRHLHEFVDEVPEQHRSFTH